MVVTLSTFNLSLIPLCTVFICINQLFRYLFFLYNYFSKYRNFYEISYLHICFLGQLSMHPFVYPSIWLSVHLPICLSANFSLFLFHSIFSICHLSFYISLFYSYLAASSHSVPMQDLPWFTLKEKIYYFLSLLFICRLLSLFSILQFSNFHLSFHTSILYTYLAASFSPSFGPSTGLNMVYFKGENLCSFFVSPRLRLHNTCIRCCWRICS